MTSETKPVKVNRENGAEGIYMDGEIQRRLLGRYHQGEAMMSNEKR